MPRTAHWRPDRRRPLKLYMGGVRGARLDDPHDTGGCAGRLYQTFSRLDQASSVRRTAIQPPAGPSVHAQAAPVGDGPAKYEFRWHRGPSRLSALKTTAGMTVALDDRSRVRGGAGVQVDRPPACARPGVERDARGETARQRSRRSAPARAPGSSRSRMRCTRTSASPSRHSPPAGHQSRRAVQSGPAAMAPIPGQTFDVRTVFVDRVLDAAGTGDAEREGNWSGGSPIGQREAEPASLG